MVPAAYAYKTHGFQHPIFTREGGSSSTRRGFQRLIFTRQSGSSSLCLQDRWVPAPNFYETGRLQQHMVWVPALTCHKGQWFQRLRVTRQMGASTQFFTRASSSSSTRRGFQRPLLTRGSVPAARGADPCSARSKFSLANYSPNWPVR